MKATKLFIGILLSHLIPYSALSAEGASDPLVNSSSSEKSFVNGSKEIGAEGISKESNSEDLSQNSQDNQNLVVLKQDDHLQNNQTNSKNKMGSKEPDAMNYLRYRQKLQIGANYTYAWIKPTQNNTTSGSLGGFQVSYEYCPLWDVYAGATFDYRAGPTSNSTTRRDFQDINPQIRIGYTFAKESFCLRYTLFTGFGCRYFIEDVKVGSSSLDFDYTEFYIPVAALLEKQIYSRFSIGCNFQWMPQVFPMVHIKPLSNARWDLTYKLANFLVEIPFKTFFAEGQYALSIAPFFEAWQDGRSKAVTQTGLPLNLPGNQYFFTGLNVNFVYAF